MNSYSYADNNYNSVNMGQGSMGNGDGMDGSHSMNGKLIILSISI